MRSVANPVWRSVPPPDAPLEQRSDDELMRLAAAGLPAAYGALVRRHQRVVRSYCARVCGVGAAADDLAQEVFLQVWRERGSYEPQGRFRSYLFTVAHRRAANELRGHKRRSEVSAEPPPVALRDPDQLDELVAAERRRRLHACVAKLPDDQRRAILLRYAAELDYDEIAEIVERPEATVRSRVFLGVARLKKLVGNWGRP